MTPAYILHRWPFQETSLLLELFTRDSGRLRVIARGARSAKNKWRGALQAFTELDVIYQGRSELTTLTQADVLQNHELTGRYLYSGFYLNELLQRLLPERYANPELFDDYQHTLQLLTEQVTLEPVLRRFEWQLLERLDLSFDWKLDAIQGDPIAPLQYYQFIPEQGFTAAPMATETQPQALIFKGDDILALGEFQLDSDQRLRYFKWLMRAALQPHLGNKPLQSRNLFSQTSTKHE